MNKHQIANISLLIGVFLLSGALIAATESHFNHAAICFLVFVLCFMCFFFMREDKE